MATKLPTNLGLKTPLCELLKLFFKIKAANAQNCYSQSHLTLAHRAEITFSRYELTLFAGYLTNGPLAGNRPVLFFKQKEFIDIIFENSYWIHLLKIRDKANEIKFFSFVRSLSFNMDTVTMQPLYRRFCKYGKNVFMTA